MRRLLRRDDGVSLAELVITVFISAVVLAGMGVWIVSASKMDAYQAEAKEAMDEVRVAKDLLVKELRFANGISTDPTKANAHVVTFWTDSRTQGTRGKSDTGIGEWVRWEILSDGRLVRSTDLYGSPTTTHARGLVYSSTGASGSVFSYPGTGVVGIHLVADLDPNGGPEAEVIDTQVTLRNR